MRDRAGLAPTLRSGVFRPDPQTLPSPSFQLRFDLIYLVLDKCDEERDRRLARHLVSLFHETAPQAANQSELMVSKELLKDYIAFAR